MWGYYTFGAGWELWDAPCHKQLPTHLQHEVFIGYTLMLHAYPKWANTGFLGHSWFVWSLFLLDNSHLNVSYNPFWISVLLLISVLPNCISWPMARGALTICAPVKTVSRLAGLHFYIRIVTVGACCAKQLCLWTAAPEVPISFWTPPNHPWDY